MLLDTSDVDLTFEAVLATRDRRRILSWAEQARTVANAAKKAREKALNEWMDEQAAQSPACSGGAPVLHVNGSGVSVGGLTFSPMGSSSKFIY